MLRVLLFIAAIPALADTTDITGAWEVTTTCPGGSSVAGLEIRLENSGYTGKSGWLVPDWGPFQYHGQAEQDAIRLTVSYGINAAESATLLANSVRYDIATLVGDPDHVVAKIPKAVLLQLPAGEGAPR